MARGGIALSCALALVAAQAAFGASAAGKPRVALDDLSPLTVVGSGFPAREAVVVTVQGKGIHLQKTVGSTAKGAFSARWNRSMVIGRCNNNAIVVTARAADGTRAVWKPVIVKPCPPPIEP